jgi:hypothetical protein
MSEADQLRQIIANTTAELLALSQRKDMDYSVNGQSFQHGAYEQKLRERIAWCESRLAQLDGAGIMVVSVIK